MSFGFTNPVPSIEDVLDDARHEGIVLLAAASNYGAGDRPSWPARESGVLSIHACTGLGNKYSGNPTPIPNRDNFSILGTAVNASWPNTTELRRKSGTSTATPLCAAIVAFVISVMRRSEEKWIAAKGLLYSAHSDDIDEERRRYRAKLRAMTKSRHIAKVLRLMVEDRDGYHCIIPWTLFDRDAYTIISAICEAIDAG
jgi:subtilisin family serine protease